MAPKDYVARGRAKKQAPPPPPSLPWVRIVITLVLILGFVYFLWFIKGKADTVPKPQQSKSVASVQQEESLPELPKEEWGYPEWFEDFTVTVEDKQQQASTKRYLMQCGSFRQQGQAEEMKAKIAFQGLVAQVRPSDGKNGRWYRVILGPYEQKRAAEKDRHTLRRSKITSCKIWYWNL